jgi:hypothetical protein
MHTCGRASLPNGSAIRYVMVLKPSAAYAVRNPAESPNETPAHRARRLIAAFALVPQTLRWSLRPRGRAVLRFPKERCAENIPAARPCGENDDRSLVKSENCAGMSRLCMAALDHLADRPSVRPVAVLRDRA